MGNGLQRGNIDTVPLERDYRTLEGLKIIHCFLQSEIFHPRGFYNRFQLNNGLSHGKGRRTSSRRHSYDRGFNGHRLYARFCGDGMNLLFGGFFFWRCVFLDHHIQLIYHLVERIDR